MPPVHVFTVNAALFGAASYGLEPAAEFDRVRLPPEETQDV
jgi:hypothetical protein